MMQKNRTPTPNSDGEREDIGDGDTTNTTPPMSAGLQLQLEDLNFLENVGSTKPNLQSKWYLVWI